MGLLADTAPLRTSDFRRLWLTGIVTVIGANLTIFAVPVQIYALTENSAYVGLAGLFALGMPFHDTEHLCAILGLLIYAIVFMWVFAARNLIRVAVILFGGGALMAALGSLIQQQLI